MVMFRWQGDKGYDESRGGARARSRLSADHEFVVLVGPFRVRKINHAADDAGLEDSTTAIYDRGDVRQRSAAKDREYRHGVPNYALLPPHDGAGKNVVRT